MAFYHPILAAVGTIIIERNSCKLSSDGILQGHGFKYPHDPDAITLQKV